MERPNILFIMSDDHAANAISAYASRLAGVFQTPNLDRIAEDGVLLTDFFSTNAICTPARASILTGQYGHINGVRTLDDSLPAGYAPNLAHMLNSAGYATALFGKWHLHCNPEGFDEFKYLSGEHGQGTYQDPEFTEKGKGVVYHHGYVTDIITDMCEDWLRARPTDRPFFLMCHHKAPHDFWEYPKRHEHDFDRVDIPLPDTLFEDRSHRSVASRDFGSSVTPRNPVRSLYADFTRPDYVTGSLTGTEKMTFREKGIAAYQKYLKDYLRTVAGIDDSVGRLLDELERQGVLDDTLVVYTSDQGMFLGEHDYQDKRWSFEEGLQAPFMVRYPRTLERGGVRTGLMANIDIAPTLLEYAGVPVPAEMQGRSFRGVLEGHPGAKPRDELYFRYWMHRAHRHDVPAHFGIRTDRWKLIFFYGLPLDAAGALNDPSPSGWELYDMINDPFECINLYREPGIEPLVRNLKNRLFNARQEFGDTDKEFPELAELMRMTGSE